MSPGDFTILYPPSSCLERGDFAAALARRERVRIWWYERDLPLPPVEDNPAAFLTTAARSMQPNIP